MKMKHFAGQATHYMVSSREKVKILEEKKLNMKRIYLIKDWI